MKWAFRILFVILLALCVWLFLENRELRKDIGDQAFDSAVDSLEISIDEELFDQQVSMEQYQDEVWLVMLKAREYAASLAADSPDDIAASLSQNLDAWFPELVMDPDRFQIKVPDNPEETWVILESEDLIDGHVLRIPVRKDEPVQWKEVFRFRVPVQSE